MYYHHPPNQSTSGGVVGLGAKHHDGPSGANGNVNDLRGASGGWSRHPSFPNNNLPIASPSGFPQNGLMGGFPGHHASHHPHSNHLHGNHVGVGSHGHHGAHPHHPSFGSQAALHLGGNQGMGMPPGQGFGGMGGYGPVGTGQGSPPRESREMPMTHHWQTQLLRAEVSGLFETQLSVSMENFRAYYLY